MQTPSTIAAVNNLPPDQKRQTYRKVIPQELLDMFKVPPDLADSSGKDLFQLNCPPGTADAELALFSPTGSPDPILFGHITDTIHGQIHILLYGMNDVRTPRFDVDRLPDGTKTQFGTDTRNLEAEEKALKAGLAPGQIYRGPRLFKQSLIQFEQFASCLGQELFFVEPLYYHIAVLFERYNFRYQTGKRLMQRIEDGFSAGGELIPLLDGSTPFRMPEAAGQISLRSWAVHDHILGRPFSGVTMYKYIDSQPDPCRDFPLPW